MVDTDGIEESLEGMARVAVTAGARLGEQLSQVIAQRARELEARTATEARDLRDRFEAERGAAVAEVRQVHGAEFWNQNDPQRIGQTFATARAWQTRAESGQDYDSAGRRAARAAELEGKQIDQETVATRMRADVSQGRPASEAVIAGKAAKARKTRIGASAGRTQQLGR
ncbi:unnamed protein product [Penicillium discolor]